MKPYHEHDCDSCIYLGSSDKPQEGTAVWDYYFCPGGRGTLVSRYGMGYQYKSCDLDLFLHYKDTTSSEAPTYKAWTLYEKYKALPPT